ncbi:MAG TPA: hypothetical protein PKK11_05975 [Methanothrix sp.]|nr:hypothetical protein [Methanothrix sp.]HPT19464.1 hypothetical protein [Methanothrix sp.]
MKYSIIAILFFIFLAMASATQIDPLGENDSTYREDIGKTMGEDILNTGQDSLGNATPVITGKNLPAASVGSQPAPHARLLSPSNNWSLNLLDSLERSASLQMSQSNDVIFGKGTVAAPGGSQGASASGTISGNKVSMDILTDDLTLFRLSLTMSGSSLSGDYHGYSPTIVTWKGIAMGKIS